MKKTLFIGGSIAVIIVALYIYYMYNKPHIDVQHQEADFEIEADIILNDFISDAAEAALKYNGKIIIVEGILNSEITMESESRSILIASGEAIINCELDSTQVPELQGYIKGDPISIKGIFVGYDDLLEELQLNNCYIGKKEESE